MAFTKLYLTANAAPYTPATIRGAWDDTAGAVTKALDTTKNGGGTITSVTRAETSTTDEYDVLLYRGVSGPLAAQTISPNIDVCIAVGESSTSQNAHWHVHIYTTQGDSDTVRQTVLSDYREAAGTNEWPTTAVGKALNAAQAGSINVSDGDRLVVEIGLASRNTSATSYTGSLWYGTLSQYDNTPAADQAAGNDRRYYAGWISFSASVAELGTITARATQGSVEAVYSDDTPTAIATQGAVEVVMTDIANPARISQAVAELALAQTAAARTTQLLVELLTPTVTESRITQIVTELLYPTVIESRLTQALVETADAGVRETRLTQHVIELLAKVSTYCGPPSLSPATLCGKPDVVAWLEWTVPMKEN